MNFHRLSRMFSLLLIIAGLSTAPADAHRKKHPPNGVVAAQTVESVRAPPRTEVAKAPGEHMAGMMEEIAAERAAMSPFERLLDWLGRLHPMIVHFPIAFFPAALFTAVIGRRRPAFSAPVIFLVVAGGLLAPVAAILGWFNGGMTLTDGDLLMRVHRWLGTGIGVAGLILAAWAWRRPDQVRGTGMVTALVLITVAIIIQGWFGGALVHGMDHMNW